MVLGSLLAAIAGEAWLLQALVTGTVPVSPPLWLTIHTVLALLVAGLCTAIVHMRVPTRTRACCSLAALFCLTIPVVGALGTVLVLLPTILRIPATFDATAAWRVAEPITLPYTAPSGRIASARERRGFVEQLEYSTDDEVLYRRVLAAGQMKASLSVAVLRRAISHADERIRLTAYQSLDRLSHRLDQRVQSLELLLDGDREPPTEHAFERSLQIAELYREMLTLEADEPVARAQLLDKLDRVIARAAGIRPDDRQVHFLRGQLELQRGRAAEARRAFERSAALGMPRQRVLPWCAEAAFAERDFNAVARLVGEVEPSLARYTPVRQVVSYWT